MGQTVSQILDLRSKQSLRSPFSVVTYPGQPVQVCKQYYGHEMHCTLCKIALLIVKLCTNCVRTQGVNKAS